MIAPTRHSRLLPASLLAICIAAALQVPTQSQSPSPRAPRQWVNVNGHAAVPGEVLVQFVDMPAAVAAQQRVIEQQIDADVNVGVGRRGLRRFRSRSFDVETLLAFFQGQPGILYVEPNYIVGKAVIGTTPTSPTCGVSTTRVNRSWAFPESLTQTSMRRKRGTFPPDRLRLS